MLILPTIGKCVKLSSLDSEELNENYFQLITTYDYITTQHSHFLRDSNRKVAVTVTGRPAERWKTIKVSTGADRETEFQQVKKSQRSRHPIDFQQRAHGHL